MKKIQLLLSFLLVFAFAKAQYVNIPDSNFRSYLIQQYPSCFNGAKQMDTTCVGILNVFSLNIESMHIEKIEGIEYFTNLTFFNCDDNNIMDISKLPNRLIHFTCIYNKLNSLPQLPDSLQSISCNLNFLTNLPLLPNTLTNLNCSINFISVLPQLPNSLTHLNCSNNPIFNFLSLPNSLQYFACDQTQVTSLPQLPDSLTLLSCNNSQLSILPTLPSKLEYLSCKNNQLTSLPSLPNSLTFLNCENNNIYCLPFVPKQIQHLNADYTTKIKCFPNFCNLFFIYRPELIIGIPYCNPTNNPNHCQSFPVIKSFTFIDANNNNKFDTLEKAKSNTKITLSNNNYTYTNNNGIAEFAADSLGTYTITATPPHFYNAVPASYTHTFSTYDTLVSDTFALQIASLKDSISIKLTPQNWAARPGFKYPYLVQYENVGTTVLSNTVVGFSYNNSLLVYDSSSNNTVTNSGNYLSLNVGNLAQGQTSSFVAYFTVKPTATIGSNLLSVAGIASVSVNAVDSVTTTVSGSYDPNDKQATPTLTPQQVVEGKDINYTIRFQNTGTDTAFTVVIADTLNSMLQPNQLQIVGSSHSCKTTLKDNIVFFEFLDINLPDSNVNKTGSNGFVSFKIKPISTVASGTIIPNKAAIYFDYNSPIFTNKANTIIQNPLPLNLLGFSAIPQQDYNKILVYWNTANEVNTSYFIIEQSLNGKDFLAAAEVPAKGIGSNSYFYSINKNSVLYLRLKMVDKNGQYTYSKVILINQLADIKISVSPSPAKNHLNVKAPTSLNNTNAKIVNAQGQIIKTFTLKQGSQTIDIAALQTGLYYLQTNIEVRKFVVEK